ncbi:MAG: hypothetical protein ACPLRW_11920 [Moorellales bacterium]
MTSGRLAELANRYRDALGPHRVKILDQLYADGRNNSLAALELYLNLEEGIIQTWYKRYRILRRHYRRMGLPVPPEHCWPPPGVRPADAAQAARAAVGGYGENRAARRNTLAARGDVEARPGRKMREHRPA